MTKVYNVLFLCTGNSARSVLAESILKKDGAGRFNAYSAGSHPKGSVHPLALETLNGYGYPADGARSKSWDEFAVPGAPKMDFVFTVCDNAAGEVCPIWPGQPMTAHWGIEDPAAAEGTELEREAAFVAAFRYLKNRISVFAALPIEKLDKLALTKTLRAIGRSEGATDAAVTIYHNPDCGTSRNVLAMIRHAGIEPNIVEYLKTPPARDELKSLIARAGLTVRDALRKKGTPYAELGLDDKGLGEDALLDAMLAHPILINRPFVVCGGAVRLCRPSDVVLDLLPSWPEGDFAKEEGAPFLLDGRIAGGDRGLVAALKAADLATDDLEEENRNFFVACTLGGSVAGYGGYERYGEDVLLRSVVVPEASRRRGIGRNLVALLLYRAFEDKGRRAWLLTNTAAPFFEKLGFKAVSRTEAPETILATRQAKDICPASAVLLSRSIGF